jgi:hypothetical protein
MKSMWYAFIDEYDDVIPYKPLSVILEAFYWYCQLLSTTDDDFRKSCSDKVYELMTK